MSDDRGDRHYDMVMLVLAAVLGVFVLAAVAFGIFNSSRVNTAIPVGGHPAGVPSSTTGVR